MARQRTIMDVLLQESVEQAYDQARLGRGDGLVERGRVDRSDRILVRGARISNL
jgi:hypothetical protein